MMQENTIKHFFGPAALAAFPRKIQSTAGKKGSIDSFFLKSSSSSSSSRKRCRHDHEPTSCPECARRCSKCSAALPEDEELCPLCNPKCARCGRTVAETVPEEAGGICIACIEHHCYVCREPTDSSSLLCKPCATRKEMRKRHRVTLSNTTTDIEDLINQAAEAKLKCDKCRGYSDEMEIKCVQKDCNNLYRRATLEIRLKNMLA